VQVETAASTTATVASTTFDVPLETLEHWEHAARHFEDALEMNERIGARSWLAHTQRDYAGMLLARDAPRDTEKAQLLVSRALTTYRDLGMESYAASVPRTGADGAHARRLQRR
jgi:hypothetical protein